MEPKNRIRFIRLMTMLNQNPRYKEELGVAVILRKV